MRNIIFFASFSMLFFWNCDASPRINFIFEEINKLHSCQKAYHLGNDDEKKRLNKTIKKRINQLKSDHFNLAQLLQLQWAESTKQPLDFLQQGFKVDLRQNMLDVLLQVQVSYTCLFNKKCPEIQQSLQPIIRKFEEVVRKYAYASFIRGQYPSQSKEMLEGIVAELENKPLCGRNKYLLLHSKFFLGCIIWFSDPEKTLQYFTECCELLKTTTIEKRMRGKIYYVIGKFEKERGNLLQAYQFLYNAHKYLSQFDSSEKYTVASYDLITSNKPNALDANCNFWQEVLREKDHDTAQFVRGRIAKQIEEGEIRFKKDYPTLEDAVEAYIRKRIKQTTPKEISESVLNEQPTNDTDANDTDANEEDQTLSDGEEAQMPNIDMSFLDDED